MKKHLMVMSIAMAGLASMPFGALRSGAGIEYAADPHKPAARRSRGWKPSPAARLKANAEARRRVGA